MATQWSRADSLDCVPQISHNNNNNIVIFVTRCRVVWITGCRFDSVVKPCWEENPAARPEFSAICASIEQFRRNAPGDDYYTAGQRDGAENFYDDAVAA